MSGRISLEVNEVSVLESEGEVFIAIVRDGDLSEPVTIEFATSEGSASGADFAGISGTVTMAAGQSRVLIPVSITDDALSEATESFTVSLINVSSGALSAPRTTQVDILDDENPVRDPVDPPLVSRFDVSADDVFGGFSQPIAFEWSPFDDSLMFVAQKDGRIRLLDTSDGSDLGDLIDLSAEVNNRQDRGLLDIALHPDLANNPYIYVFVVVDPPETIGQTGNAGPDGGGNRYSHVLRFTLDESDGYQSIVEGSKVVLLGGAGQSLSDISGNGAIDSTSNITIAASDIDPVTGEFIEDYIKVDSRSHAGGSLEFGPDGALYISTGDGTSFNTTDPRSVGVQDVNSLAGKILRVDPITGEGLPDNPFFTGDPDANASKVYQLGLRNPFSMSFDGEGQLIITDTGWFSWEELNAGPPGANFGWPFFEGGDNGDSLPAPGYRDLPEAAPFYAAVDAGEIEITAPFRGFAHNSNAPGFQVQAITGADDLINSDLYPDALQGYYIFTDVSQGEVFAVNRNDQRDVVYLYTDNNGFGPVHFKQGPDGFMYYADIRSGQIGRLEIIDPNEPVLNLVEGTPGSELIFGTDADDFMDGIGGGDFFFGSLGDDTILGDSALYDQVDYRGDRSDYTFTRNGDGSVTVTSAMDGTDTLIDVDGFWFQGSLEWFSLEQVLVAPGGQIVGTAGDDILNGTPRDDTMIGNGGSDQFQESLGDDTIIGDAGVYSQVNYFGRLEDYTFTRNGDGTVTVVNAQTGTDTLTDIDGFWFNGASLWLPIEAVVAPAGGSTIEGTPGDDILDGTIADDIMIGNGGSDQFQESLGDDTIIGDAGVYSQVNYFGRLEDYTFTRNGDGTVTVVNAQTGTDTLTDIDGFWFNGSFLWLPIEAVLPPVTARVAVEDVLSSDQFDFSALDSAAPPTNTPRAEILDFMDFGARLPVAASTREDAAVMEWDVLPDPDLPDFGDGHWDWDQAPF